MICNKCHAELPDDARFCQSCGSLVEPVSESRTVCGNCGLELPKGAKFCAVCGTAVNGADASATFAGAAASAQIPEPVGGASLGIDGNAATMPFAGAAASVQIPEPVGGASLGIDGNAATMPFAGTAASAQIPEPVGNTFGGSPEANFTGYSAPTSDNSFGFADYGMSAAAVAVSPIKKKSVLKPVLITIGAVLAVVLIAAASLFIFNRRMFYSIFLGNSGYAAMVEGNSIRSISDEIDYGALSEGIRSASGPVINSMLYGYAYADGDMSLMRSSYGIADSYYYDYFADMDIGSMVSLVYDSMLENYGANSAAVSVSSSLELTDSAKALIMSELGCTAADVEKILSAINDTSAGINVKSAENAFETDVEVTSGGMTLNFRTVVTDDGSVYLLLPFVSDKAFAVRIGTSSAASAQTADVYIEFDEKELEKLVNDLVNIYLDVYKSSEITVDNGEISAAGVITSGKLMTVNLTGEKLTEIVRKWVDSLADNNYFCDKIVEFAGYCGAAVTSEDVASTLAMMENLIEIPDEYAIIVRTITDNSCNVIAKSYVFTDGSGEAAIIVSGNIGINDKCAVALEADGSAVLTVVSEKTSDTEGVIDVNIYDDDDTASFRVKFSDIREAKFNGKTVYEGTYELSLNLPQDFTEEFTETDNASAIIASSKLVFSVRVENESTVNETISLEIPQYGKLSFVSTLTAANDASAISVPSDVIDITEAFNGGEVSEELQEEFLGYLEDVRTAFANQGGELADGIVDLLDGMMLPAVDESVVRVLFDYIQSMEYTVEDLSWYYGVDDADLVDESDTLADKFEELSDWIADKDYTLTEDEYADAVNRYYELMEAYDELENKYINASPVTVGGGIVAADVDFSSLDFDSLLHVLIEYEARYSNQLISYNPDNALYEAAESAYVEAVNDFNSLYDEYYEGTLNASKLRDTRESAEKFALAVEALEQAESVS